MADAPRISVFLLAHNRLLGEAFSKIFSRRGDMLVVGYSPFSPQCAEYPPILAPAVLVVDCTGTTPAHIDLIRMMQKRVAGMQVVMIGMEPDEASFLHAIRVGALGYVLKDASAIDVTAAIRIVAKGGAVCTPELCAFLFRHTANQAQMPSSNIRGRLGLTIREQQLVSFISRGLTNKEIAAALQLSEQTVRNHVHTILRKTGANHRLAAVDICRREGGMM